MQHMRTAIHRDGPVHLGLWLNGPDQVAVRSTRQNRMRQQRLQSPAVHKRTGSEDARLQEGKGGGETVGVSLHYEGGDEVVGSASVALDLAGRKGVCEANCSGQLSRGGSCSVRFDTATLNAHLTGGLLEESSSGQSVHSPTDTITIRLSDLQISILSTVVTSSGGAGGQLARLVMQNFSHLVALAQSDRQPSIKSIRFNMCGRDWLMQLHPDGDPAQPSTRGKLMFQLVLDHDYWCWAAFSSALVVAGSAHELATPRGAEQQIHEFASRGSTCSLTFMERPASETVAACIAKMVVASVHTTRDAIIWEFDGAANIPLSVRPSVNFTFRRAGCKWIVSLFLTHDSESADVGVRLQCLSDNNVVASLTVALDSATGVELDAQRIVDHRFVQPLQKIFKRRLFATSSWLDSNTTPENDRIRLRISGLCAGWCSVPAGLKASMLETSTGCSDMRLVNTATAGKLEKLEEKGWSRTSSMLRMGKKKGPTSDFNSGTSLVNLTMHSQHTAPQKVCWSVRVTDIVGDYGLGCGVARRDCDALHGTAALLGEREGGGSSFEGGAAPVESGRNPDLEVLLTRICFGERVGTPMKFDSREWRLCLVRVLTKMRHKGGHGVSDDSFGNMTAMVREAIEEAVKAAEWKVGLDLLQMGCTYHNQAGELMLTLLTDLTGLDARFWYGAYFAQCNHERQKAVETMDVRSSVDMRMIEENTYLSQALTILGLMKDMGVDSAARFQMVQQIVAKGLIPIEQANAWFSDTLEHRVLAAPNSGAVGDELEVEDARPPDCLLLHCSSKPAAAAASRLGPWVRTAAEELTTRAGDTVYHSWVYNPAQEIAFLRVSNSPDGSTLQWQYTAELRIARDAVDEWRPAVWLGPGAGVSLRAEQMWTVPVKPPDRPKVPVCAAVEDQADAVSLRWDHNPISGDTPTSEYIIQCRRLGKQHGARPGAREWVTIARADPAGGGQTTHETQLELLLPSTDYSFRIVAQSLAGASAPSNPCGLWRTSFYPRLSGLQVVSASETTIELSWDAIWWPANQVWDACAVEVLQVELGDEELAAEVSPAKIP